MYSSTSGGKKSENRIIVWSSSWWEITCRFTWQRERERHVGPLPLFIKALNPCEGPDSNTSQRPLLQMPSHCGGGFWHVNRGPEDTNIQHSGLSGLLQTFEFPWNFQNSLISFFKKPFIINDDFFQTYRLIQKEFTLRKYEIFLSMKIIYFFHQKIFRSFKI